MKEAATLNGSPTRILSRDRVRAYYDRLGSGLDRAELFESRAKRRGVERLALAGGERMIELGVGTGLGVTGHLRAVGSTGSVLGLDISATMIALTRDRAGVEGLDDRLELRCGPVEEAGIDPGSRDAFFSSYVLDLLPEAEIGAVLREAHRIVRPGGRIVLVGMTPAHGLAARILMTMWGCVYRIEPAWLGGCRPLKLTPFLEEAGFVSIEREIVEQLGFPSEVVAARRGDR